MFRYLWAAAGLALLMAQGCAPRVERERQGPAAGPSNAVQVDGGPAGGSEDWTEQIDIGNLTAAGYVVTWTRPAMPGPCAIAIRRGGRTLRRFGFDGWVDAEAFEPGGGLAPHLLVSYYSGGPHCCETKYFYSLGRRLRHLGTFDAHDALAFEANDANGDGIKDAVCADDSFDYFHCCHANSPTLPYVLVYRKGRYVDGTPECRWLLRQEMAASERALQRPPKQPLEFYDEGTTSDQERQAHIVQYYGLGALLGERGVARTWLEANLDPTFRKWFADRRKEIGAKLRERPDKLTYKEPGNQPLPPSAA